jgi:hypothetical protein
VDQRQRHLEDGLLDGIMLSATIPRSPVMMPRSPIAPSCGVVTSVAAMLVIVGCGGSPPAPVPPAAAPTDATTAAAPADAGAAPATAAASAAQPLTATAASWTPEALEDLLAPVALYPDPVLAQLLVAVTNPQEVLDAGNWLIANPNLTGGALDDAAEKIGFTLPMRSIMQFPEVVDQLCLNMGWTEELGQAYVNDQVGVMDAVQRLRVQAKDVGNLKTSKEMKVETVKQESKEVVTVAPAQPQVVYVPQYDPVAAYAPPGTTPSATTTTVTAPSGTTTVTTPPGGTTNVTVNQGTAAAPAPTTTTTPKDNTGSLIATGLLAFGAGMLVNEAFDDDEDDYWGAGYYGGMYARPPPPYPPYPYRPAYGNGYYPNNAYKRPTTYARGGNTIVVNQNNNYYNRYGNQAAAQRNRVQPQSPITAARPQRNDLNTLNARAASGPSRRAQPPPASWKGQSGYAGADPEARAAAGKPAAATTSSAKARTAPKAQGGYAGVQPQQPRERERPATSTTSAANTASTTRSGGPAATGGGDRGRAPAAGAGSSPAQRPAATPTRTAAAPSSSPRARETAVSSAGSGRSERAASARGRQSVPAGGATRARQGGGGRGR